MRPRHLLGIAGALALIGAGTLWSVAASNPEFEAARHHTARLPTESHSVRSSKGAMANWQKPVTMAQKATGLTPEQRAIRQRVLDSYLVQAQYPPTSKPLTRHQDDLIHPNKRYERKRRTDTDSEVSFLFTADRYYVVGDEPLHVSLQVERDGLPVAVQILRSTMVPIDPREGPLAAPAPIALEEQDGLYVAAFKPKSLFDLTRASILVSDVLFDFGGEEPQAARFNLHFTPDEGVPAIFTGRFRHHVLEGSLVIEASVRVRQPGYFIIDANLWGEDDAPVAWTRFKGELQAGIAWVPLNFFGKAVRDSGVGPPYVLSELRGARFVEGGEPDLERMPTYTESYRATGVAPDDLSDAVWNSDAKQAKIDALRDALEKPNQKHPTPPTDIEPMQ